MSYKFVYSFQGQNGLFSVDQASLVQQKTGSATCDASEDTLYLRILQ